MNKPQVFVIILNWNGINDTLECIKSVSTIDYPNFRIVVVDNGSSDESVNAIQRQYPEVTVLETKKNLGFAGGNNVGIQYALRNEAGYIFLLNNDTIVDSQLLKNLLNAEQKVKNAGILGAKIYYYSQPNMIWYAGGEWSKERKHFVHVGQGSIDNGREYNDITETDYACGCAFFIKADVFHKVGLFDEQFFLTFEETDLCFRARRAGYRCYFVPDAKIWHKVSVAFGGENSPLFHYFMMRNKLLWAEKNLSYYEKLQLYRVVISEILRYILPPRFRLNGSSGRALTGKYFSSLREYKDSFVEKYSNPMRKAKLWGVRDYVLRRFGDCPESVRFLRK